MKKRSKYLIIICLILLIIVGMYFIVKPSDAKRFKKEYEKYNDVFDESYNIMYRTVTISLDNPFNYASAKDILKLVNNKETFLVYFGDGSSHWCRLVIEQLLKALNEENVQKVYYININEIRDEKYISEDNVLIETKGTNDYYKVLEIFNDILDEYDLYDDDGNMLSSEKRIFDSTFIAVKNGIPVGMTTGIKDNFSSLSMNLTKEMLLEQQETFKEVIDYTKLTQSCSAETVC